MVNLKTKLEKHANDDEKRRQSLKEWEKAKLNQSKVIKHALSSAALQNSSSKKITFKDESDEDDELRLTDVKKNLKKNKKSHLFENSESSENEDFEIKEKIHFSGKEGFELLKLQSTYGNDERFKIDERFLENDKKNLDEEENEVPGSEMNSAKEKTKQLKILESVLGTPFEPEKEKKSKKRVYEMVRYDASNKDHEIFEINTQSHSVQPSLKKRKEEKKAFKSNIRNLHKPEVSKEKFYEVSSEIKNQLKKKENGHFSVLETYGVSDTANGQESNHSETHRKKDLEGSVNKIFHEDSKKNISEKYEYKMNADYDELKRENKEIDQQHANGFRAKGIWKEPFFFDQDDVRFKDALEFINQRNSAEATEAMENYEKTRKSLKEILRLHLKKHQRKKDPFKKKIGGMNKKQLAKTNFRNPKMLFNKRIPSKRNPRKS